MQQGFKLAVGFPRRLLPCDAGITLQEAGLSSGDALLVLPLADE